MEQQTEEVVEQTEEPEEVIEKKIKKKPTFTEEQLERKRLSMNKAREFRNQKIKQYEKEIQELKTEIKKKPIREPIQEPIKEVVQHKPVSKYKPVSSYEYEETEDEDDDDEIIEKVITIRKKRNDTRIARKPQITNEELVEQSYREQLQQKLNEERRRRVMQDLFDF
jgi:hypothetical protein